MPSSRHVRVTVITIFTLVNIVHVKFLIMTGNISNYTLKKCLMELTNMDASGQPKPVVQGK